MTGSFILLIKLNMYLVLGIMYIYGIGLVSNTYNKDLYNRYNIPLVYFLPLIFLTGLPPSPLFFCKAWAMGFLVKASWGLGIFVLLFFNSILLIAYLNTINKNELEVDERNFETLQKTKIDAPSIILLFFIFLFAPKTLIIF